MANKPIVISEKSESLFFARLKRRGNCQWQGRRTKRGYGRFGFRRLPAHRVAYFLATGVDPGDRLVWVVLGERNNLPESATKDAAESF
jgi:hypothetical protein